MESDQQIAETGLAVADIDLQDTVRLPLEEDEREEMFHDSMTEEQWKQQLGVPTSGTEESRAGPYPPTHTDHEKSKQPQSSQDAEDSSGRRMSREIRMLGSYNTRGTEENEMETLPRRRPVPLRELITEFEFYERKADSAESYLPNARTGEDDQETKRNFAEFKAAVDGMRLTGQRITEKLVSDGSTTEANMYNEKVNRKYTTILEMRSLYWDSYTGSA